MMMATRSLAVSARGVARGLSTSSPLHAQPALRLSTAVKLGGVLSRQRGFHATAVRAVKVGDALPDVDLMEDSPGNKVNLKNELAKGKGLVIGVPAAFSPSCSGNHIPGYISSPKLSSAGKVFVVSVNDPFVMKAWSTSLDPSGSSNIRFLADPGNDFTSALELDFDGTQIFGNRRSVRYALLMEDGKVVSTHVEPERTPVDVSAASKVLG